MRICTRCATGVADGQPCPTCVKAWEKRTDASEMTPEERAAEFDSWTGVLEIGFSMLHERIEELVGRPVWTHELARIELLRHEILTGEHPSMEGVLAKLPADMPVLVVEGE